MELLQLTYLFDAAETESFSRTAQRFTAPSSNISQSVKRLETELGARASSAAPTGSSSMIGVAYVPALTWRGQFSDRVELRKMGDYVREVCVYRRPEARHHKLADAFDRILSEEFEKEANA